MIRVLENNTLGVVLASISGVLLLAVLGLIVVWALPPSSDFGDEDSADSDTPVSIASLQQAGPLEDYSVVSERPVFNEDRRPAPVLDEEEGFVEETEEEYVGAPDVELAGIIITPTLKMVTLKSPEHEHSLVAFEGQPLEGDFGTWQVSRIEERRVTLASADGEEMQLELQVHDVVIDEPPEVRRATERDESGEETLAANDQESSEPLTRAEEIRQRIEERREELRRQAETAQEDEAQNYKDAIQSIIKEGRREAPRQAQEEPSEEEQQ
jgi:general secretion pathway protein N